MLPARRQAILNAKPQKKVGLGQAKVVPRPGPLGRPMGGNVGGMLNRASVPQASSSPSPSPWDSAAQGSADAALLNYNNAITGIQGNWQAEQEDFGLGAYSNNPYSHAAMLKRERDIGNRGVLNSAGLQLYSGSTVNKARGVAGAYDRNYHGLETEYTRAGEQAKQREREAEGTYQDALAAAREAALQRAIESEPAPEPVPPAGPSYVPGSVAAKSGKGSKKVAIANNKAVSKPKGKGR